MRQGRRSCVNFDFSGQSSQSGRSQLAEVCVALYYIIYKIDIISIDLCDLIIVD